MSNDRISKEAVALGAAVLLVGGSMLLAGQSQQPTDRTGAKASSPSFVVAVNSSSGAAASAAWNASGMTNLPGDVLVLPPSTSTACPERISDAARAGGVISSSAGCSAPDPGRATALNASLRQAADEQRGRGGSVVLVGDGWTQQVPVPVPVEQRSDAAALARAMKDAQVAGAVPDLRGIEVVVAGPKPPADVKRVWEAYFAAAGVSTVQWIAP